MMEVDLIWALGFVAGAVAAYLVVKARIRQFRQLVDIVDDALVDDKVSEAEFRAIFAAFKRLIGK